MDELQPQDLEELLEELEEEEAETELRAEEGSLSPSASDARVNHQAAMLISILVSLPIVACASLLWILGGLAGNDQTLYRWGDTLYKLGAPLTMIVLSFPDYAGRYLTRKDDLWAIPLTSLLFVVQWLIWGQALVLIIRGLRARRERIR